MDTYPRQVKKAKSPQILCGVLTTCIHIRLLDDLVDHLNDEILMGDQPLDGTGDDRTLPRH